MEAILQPEKRLLEMVIRESSREDWSTIALLLGELWPNKKIGEGSSEIFIARLKNPQYVSLVAAYDGELVGFISGSYRSSLWIEAPILNIDELIVSKRFQRKGIGRLLMEAICNSARANGCELMELDSGFHRTEAHSFYVELGFEQRALKFSKKV